MVGCFFADGGTDAITTLTLSGWTQIGPGEAGSETSRLIQMIKVAVSADVAASDFTFTTNYSGSGGGKVGGAILRVTNFASSTTPVTITDEDAGRNATGASFTSFTGTFTPEFANSLVLMMIAGTNNETGTGTFSGYTVSGTNLTWTEHFDIFDADGDDAIFAVASAVDTTTTTRTTASATCSVAQDDYILLMSSFLPIVNVSADLPHLAITPSLEGITASQVNVATNISNLSTTPTITGVETSVTQPSVWTNTPKS